MALETLKGVEKIGGFEVTHFESVPDVIETDNYIGINHDQGSIWFQIQNGPVKENGVNGCQVLTMIQASLIIIRNLNKRFPCMENDITIENLESAIAWQENRTLNREKRNVEGKDEL